MNNKSVFLAGHQGMVGSAIHKTLLAQGYPEPIVKTRSELDLLRQQDVELFFQQEKVDQVIVASAKVGGIHANNEFPAEFIYQNLMIECNLIHAAFTAGVKELLFLGSSCIYPKFAEQPMQETALLSGVLEPTNEPYAIAKIAGIKLCESYNRQYGVDYRSAMPTNLYGENDNFHPTQSHVVPAMMRRFHEAKLNGSPSVTIWGSGKPKREFLHVQDMADACIHLLTLPKERYWLHVDDRCSHVNVGTGVDCSIKELAETMAEVVGFEGTLNFDSDKPDGSPRKLLNIDLISQLGWRPSISLIEGLQATYQWYLKNEESIRQ